MWWCELVAYKIRAVEINITQFYQELIINPKVILCEYRSLSQLSFIHLTKSCSVVTNNRNLSAWGNPARVLRSPVCLGFKQYSYFSEKGLLWLASVIPALLKLLNWEIYKELLYSFMFSFNSYIEIAFTCCYKPFINDG